MTPALKGASKAQEMSDFADKIGIPLLPWQRFVAEDMLKINKDGNYVRKTVGILVARQNGKTHLARMRILAGLFLWGERNIVAMSSNRNMALDTFRQVCDVINSNDWLLSQVDQIRYANGQESVTLLSGARYEIVAATRDGARGKTADLLYIDELREVPTDAWTAARPITRARPNGVIMATSNAGDAFSVVLNDLRERALSYPSKAFGWYEYSAEPFCKIQDKTGWQAANPALGYLITEETIEESIATSTVEATRTETLCQWVDALASPWPYRAFEDLTKQDLVLNPGALTIMAVDISPSRRNGSLVAGQLTEDGKIGIGIMQQWQSDVAVDDLKISSDIHAWVLKYNPQMLCYDKYATASIAQRLEQSGVKCVDMSGQVFYQACGELLDSIVNLRLVHNGQNELIQSMNNCAAKTNDAGWRIIRRKSAGDVSAAIGIAMVNHQLIKPQSVPKIFA